MVPAEVAMATPPKPEPSPAALHGLTPREVDVLELLREGCSNRMIGERLFISERTARTHVQNILIKLDVGTRTAAAAYALEHGLLAPRHGLAPLPDVRHRRIDVEARANDVSGTLP
jgi:DNA-binding NarL/FixJ family response regulator